MGSLEEEAIISRGMWKGGIYIYLYMCTKEKLLEDQTTRSPHSSHGCTLMSVNEGGIGKIQTQRDDHEDNDENKQNIEASECM